MPDSFSGFMSKRDHFVNGNPGDRNEWQYIGRAYARMLALVLSQVDQGASFGDRPQRSFHNDFWFTDKSDDRAIVIHVDVAIKHNRSGNRFNRQSNLFDRFRLAAFAEVWYTLNQAIFDL